MECALRPARPRRPALRESLRSRAGTRGAPRGRPTSRRGSGAEAASAPSPGGPPGGGVWRGASEGEGASFCLRGRCAARLRARAGGPICSALRGHGRQLRGEQRGGSGCAPSFKGFPGYAARTGCGGWGGDWFPGPPPTPPPPEEDVSASLLPGWLHTFFESPSSPKSSRDTPEVFQLS